MLLLLQAPVDADPNNSPLRRFSEVKPPPTNGHQTTTPIRKQPEKRPLGRTQSSPLVDPDDLNILGKSCEEILSSDDDLSDYTILDSCEMRDKADAVEAMLQRSVTPSSSQSSPSLFAAVRGRLNKKLKKNSLDNLFDDSIPAGSGDEDRSSSSTPPEGQSPIMPRKGKQSTGLFRIGRRKGKHVVAKLKASASHPEKLGQESNDPSLSPPAVDNDTELFAEGGGRLPRRDPAHRVSRPLMEEQCKDGQVVSYNLQKLVSSLPKAWTKCGYLWLRMKLPNNIYAWTYIVS